MKLQLGIDEAGRGPVVGPLVMAGCVTSAEIDDSMRTLGVKDSKLILPNKRKFLLDKVKEQVIDYEIIVVSPDEIDAALNNPDLNLNKLEALTSAKIIKALVQRNPDLNLEVMLDSPTNTPAPYIAFVEGLVKNSSVTIKAEIKADANYISVGCASILAKVTRDTLIEEMQEQVKSIVGTVEIGSGYPSDPKTKLFIAEYWDKLDSVKGGFFRKTWKTYQNVAKLKSQKGLGEF